jgi:putative Holliday junction resolvase
MKRILAVDPGEKRIGLAISDPTGTLARPLKVIMHTNREADAADIASIAASEQVGLIIVGQATDIDGKPNFSGRKARRLAGAIRSQTEIPVELWDESHSTKAARQYRADLGVGFKRRRDHMDDRAAAVILQSYLDTKAEGDSV